MNIPIDVRQLRYFIAVAETQHFGRAAERLHISQPPLSRQIQQLEQALGVMLFHRQHSGAILTEAGQAILPEARKTLAQLEKTIALARMFNNTDTTALTIGYTTVFDQSILPPALPHQLEQQFPQYRVHLQGQHSVQLVKAVKNKRMDMALIGLHTATEGLPAIKLQESPMILALSSHHPLAKKRMVGLADLHTSPLFWFERRLNPGFYDYCQRCFELRGYHPATLTEPADHHILLGQIATGDGVALIPASLCHIRRQGVVFRPLKRADQLLTTGVVLIHHPDVPSELVEHIRRYWEPDIPGHNAALSQPR